MVDAAQIKGQMEVKGSDGKHIGTVDGMEGQRVRLASGGMYQHSRARRWSRLRHGRKPPVIGLPVYSSDGQKLGEVTDVLTSGSQRAVRAEMGEFLGLGSTLVVTGADAFQQKADRIELSMTAAQVREALMRQRKNKQEQN